MRTTCPYCGVGCGVLAGPDAVAGDPDHPANLGRLCSKGLALHETLSDATRLLHPRIGGRRCSWDAALGAVAGAFAETIARHGPDSVALYVSGQLLTEDYYAANKLAKGFLGTGNIDSNSRLCMSSAVAGHVRAFGEDVVPVGYDDLLAAELVVLVGSNTAWCHPVLYQRMRAAGMPYVVVDPRRTPTAEDAVLHLGLRPGSDVALFNGLLAYLAAVEPCRLDLPGAGEALRAARAEAPDARAVAAACDLDVEDVRRFFALFAGTRRVVTLFSQGVNQSTSGTDKVSAIVNVHLLSGRMGEAAGPFSITGQPNAMGGREVGALANLLAGHLDWDAPGEVEAVRGFWNAPRMACGPGLKAVELFRAVGRGEVRALWIMGTNPAVSMPDGEAVRRALGRCPFVAVSDCADGTDTLGFAHVALPAQGWGERDGTVTNSERVISRQRPFRPIAGQARADWQIVAGVAARLGFGDAFAWDGPHAVFAEHARLTGLATGRRRMFDISGLGDLDRAGYESLAPTRWPVPRSGAVIVPGPAGGEGWPTPDGRPRLVAVSCRPPAEVASDAWPLILLTGRIRDQWHTMTRTGLVPRLLLHIAEPYLAIHPDDARGMDDGSLARLTTARGGTTLRVRHDRGQRRGEVFAPMHWTDTFAPPGRINAAVQDGVCPSSGQPELKHTPARADPLAVAWQASVLARSRVALDNAAWRASWPLDAGLWRTELAGDGAPDDAFTALRALLDGQGAWTVLRDASAGAFRGVRLCGDRPEAAILVGPGPILADLDWLAARFAEPAPGPAARRALLAAQPASGARPDPTVCVCHGIGQATILAAITQGARTVADVGQHTAAGTGCGSCQPEIAAMLRNAFFSKEKKPDILVD